MASIRLIVIVFLGVVFGVACVGFPFLVSVVGFCGVSSVGPWVLASLFVVFCCRVVMFFVFPEGGRPGVSVVVFCFVGFRNLFENISRVSILIHELYCLDLKDYITV